MPVPSAAAGTGTTLSEGQVDLLLNLHDEQVQRIAAQVFGEEDNKWSRQPITFTKAELLSLRSTQQRNILLRELARLIIPAHANDASGRGQEWQKRQADEPDDGRDDRQEEESTAVSSGSVARKRGEIDEELEERRCSGSARQGFRVCGCRREIWEYDYVLDLLSLLHSEIGCPATCDLQEPANALFATLPCDSDTDQNATYWHQQIDLLSVPLVLFHLSDEACQCPPEFLREVYPRFRLVLRQHACREALQDFFDEVGNVVVMPLGYGSNFTGGQPAMQVIDAVSMTRGHERPYKWSFQGGRKWDREEGLRVFSDLEPNFAGIQGHIGKWELFSLYHESLLVLSGRGDQQADCFRHYEASIAGAIPVVVSPLPLILDSFSSYRDGLLPPWIFAETWEEARELAQELLQGEFRQSLLLLLLLLLPPPPPSSSSSSSSTSTHFRFTLFEFGPSSVGASLNAQMLTINHLRPWHRSWYARAEETGDPLMDEV